MTTHDAISVGLQLDQHHVPETNGRMAVCRRCGGATNGPGGLNHIPYQGQLVRASDWLDAQSRLVDIERARVLRAK
jgi:hypothetical protein